MAEMEEAGLTADSFEIHGLQQLRIDDPSPSRSLFGHR